MASWQPTRIHATEIPRGERDTAFPLQGLQYYSRLIASCKLTETWTFFVLPGGLGICMGCLANADWESKMYKDTGLRLVCYRENVQVLGYYYPR